MALGKEGNQDLSQAPHWMRLLEEKYQRLHAKILNQAARFTHRRASNITTSRVLKESHRRRATSFPCTNQSELEKDQEENPSQFDEAEINEAANLERDSDTFAQVECVQTYNRKQATRNLPAGQRPLTREGTRSRVFSDTTLGESSFRTTPQSSGVVTRISSAIPRTRISSAYDVSLQSPRDVSILEDCVLDSEGHASQLDQALRLQLENQNEEWAVGLRDRLSKATNHISWDEGEDDEATSEKMNIQCQTERGDFDAMTRRRRRHISRPVKTSVSRISHKTSKSCPASFVQPVDITHSSNIVPASATLLKAAKNVPASVIPLTAKGVKDGRMRVFARMSQEARHAVDETLKEMKMEEAAVRGPSPHLAPDAVNGNTPNDNDDDVDNNNYKSDDASNSSLRNNVSAPTGVLCDLDIDRQNDRRNKNDVNEEACSDISLASDNDNDYATGNTRQAHLSKPVKNKNSTGLFGATNRNDRLTANGFLHNNSSPAHHTPTAGRRLPQLDEGITLYQEGFPAPHPLLPSIKKANLAFRENTFEITPPGFDIRFREIITCQKGDRDTPPLDVRQQSIEKCQQWLVQHTPRR